MRRFTLVRTEDVSGVSGTGTVVEGVEFSDGSVVLRWLGPRSSTVFWKNIEDAIGIHGHDGRTTVVWQD
jgi:hypothetical protein